jgi:protein-tyrosine kinase
MSIIENAARRLEQTQRATGPVANSVSGPASSPASSPAAPTGTSINSHARAESVQVNDAHGQALRDEAAPVRAPEVHTNIAQLPRPGDFEVGQPKKFARIDLDRMHEKGMVVSNGERTSVAEEFRVIKRPLLRAVMPTRPPALEEGNPSNLIMVTSSLPKEGKTFCAINLAMSIATEKDYTVLLVDADVARPSVLKTLGIQADTGLMDLLQNPGMDVADTIIHTNIPSLSIIPAGKSSRHATELLASHDMARLVQELARRYPDRIVIFDSPPLLATTEAQVLANHMGQVVLVVEAERTTHKQLKEALSLLDGRDNVNLLYNKARSFATEAKYGYY